MNNKYTTGLKGGRPPIYQDNEKGQQELQERCKEYFEYIKGEKETVKEKVNGKTKEVEKIIREPEPATITGLTLFLGFCNKSTLYDYAKKEGFSNSIKRAITIIEQQYETRLYQNNPTGAIFALKNLNWKDKSEVEQKSDLTISWNEEKTYD